MPRALLACFFLSGAAALVYEVIWTRELVLVVGGTRPAVSMVLAAFMAGMAAGSAVAGPLADRVRRPLRLYALLELAIAAAAVSVPALLDAVGAFHAGLYRDPTGPAAMAAVRFGLSFLCLALPAALMGATFPAMLRAVAGPPASVGRAVSIVYAVNTTGAVVGCLAAAFVLIPAVGMRGAGWIAAAINALVAAIAWNAAGPVEATADAGEARAPAWPPAAAAAVGFTALAYEVAWTRVLTLIVGTTVYAFATMLAAFLTGIAAGGFLVARRADRWTSPARAIGAAQGAVALLTIAWIAALELPFRALAWLQASLRDEFLAFSAARLVLTFVVLAGVTIPMGMTFPLLIKLVHRRAGRLGRDGGGVYAANTLGAVAGALLAGIVLLPRLGVHGTLAGIAALNALLAAAFLATSTRRRVAWIGAGAATAAVALLATPRADARLLNSGVYEYAEVIEQTGFDEHLASGRLLFYEEGVNAAVAVTERDGLLTIQTNGKTDGGPADDATQLLLGHLPLLLHPQPRSVLVIGYGVGCSLGAVTTHPVERVVCVEIERAVLHAAPIFAEHYGRRPADDPRVQIVVEDGRLHAAAIEERFDVIVSQPSNPWHVGVSNLFTVEFFRALRARAAPGGVVCVWVPLYRLAVADARTVFRTFREVFPEATLWQAAQHDALLIARAEGPLTVPFPSMAAAFERNADLRNDLTRIGVPDWSELMSRLLMDAANFARFTEGAPLNTDDLPLLEFRVPLRSPAESRVGVVQRAVRDHYLRQLPEAGFEVSFEPYGGAADRFEAMALQCRPGGGIPRVEFAGLARAYGEPAGADDVNLAEQTVATARIEWAGMRVGLRSHVREPTNLWETIAAFGVRDARSLEVRGHPALLALGASPEGWMGVLTWHCPFAGRLYVAVFGPMGGEPAAADVDRLGLRCLHPGE